MFIDPPNLNQTNPLTIVVAQVLCLTIFNPWLRKPAFFADGKLKINTCNKGSVCVCVCVLHKGWVFTKFKQCLDIPGIT